MSNQLCIVFPMARNADPATSHEAAGSYAERLSTRRAEVLDLVKRYPGHTGGEYGRLFFNEHPSRPIEACAATPKKRLVELERLGFVRRGTPRICNDTGNRAAVWYATSKK